MTTTEAATPGPSRRALIAGGAAALALTRAGRAAGRDGVVNPLVPRRADAQIMRAEDGWLYMTATVPEYDRLVLRRARTVAGLASAPERILWRHAASGDLGGYIWAPELHRVDGQWTMYFAAGPAAGGGDVFAIRTYALVCDGPDPLSGAWTVLGRLVTPWDTFTLDSTSFVHCGTRYLAWAQREPGIDTNSNLYLAPLATPLTLAAKPARLSVPTLPWEVRGYKVNEGPALLARHRRLFLTYSASATDARYCLGMLTARDDADIMDPASWTKSPVPVMTTSAARHVYGPGHNSFFVDERGHDMMSFHARDYAHIDGDPLLDPNRSTRVQFVRYDSGGVPLFDPPAANGPLA